MSMSATMEYQQAMDRIRDEMAEKSKRPEVVSVGEVMTQLLEAFPEWAGAILAEGKTLAGAYQALEDYAREQHKKGGRCVYLGPDRSMQVLAKYYGVKAEGPAPLSARAGAAKAQAPAEPAKPAEEPGDALSLDALLGGI